MMKRLRMMVIVMALLLALPETVALAETDVSMEQEISRAADEANLGEWDQIISILPSEVRDLWNGRSARDMVEQYALGESLFHGQHIWDAIAAMADHQWPEALGLLIRLLALSLLTGFIQILGKAGMEDLRDVAGFVCYCFAALSAITAFVSLVLAGGTCIKQLTTFIELAFPPLLTLLTAVGGISSAGAFQPAMALLCSGVSNILQSVVIPIVLAGGVMGILNHMTGRVQLGQLFGLSKSVAKWMIGLTFTLYFGITALQGMTTATFDGISIRTAKFAMDKFVPIVGGMVSGTMDMVLGCAILVKNAAGLVSILLAAALIGVPLFKIMLGMFAFRLAAALSEPLSDVRIPKMYTALADVLSYIFAAIVALGAMFMITAGLMMSAGNATVLSGG